MGKMNGENSDLKSKLNVVSGVIANAKKDLESLKTEINDVKSDHAMIKKDLNYVNIKNRHHVVKNDMLIFTTDCTKLKSMIRENVKSLKNRKNNLYSVKKDSDSIQIDLKKLKEEFINNSNERAKIRSIILAKIKAYHFKERMRALVLELALPINNSKIKTNIKDNGIVDACTSTDDPIVKKYVDTCTSTDDLIVRKYLMLVLVQMFLLLKIMLVLVLVQMMYVLMKMNHVLMKMSHVLMSHVLMKMSHVLMKMNRVLVKINCVLMKMNHVLAMMMMMSMMMRMMRMMIIAMTIAIIY